MEKKLPWLHGALKISENNRFLEHKDGTPFFWLGDTGWLLFSRLNKKEAEIYLDNRKEKGFNVIQVMIIHDIPEKNIFGKTVDSLEEINWDIGPLMTDKNDYWVILDEYIKMAEDRGIYMALVPIWGSVVKSGHLSANTARGYGQWLGKYFKNRPNIIWLNGGDTRGDENVEVWKSLATGIKEYDNEHLMTFHPFGRTKSSMWFHSEPWLDFNMFQSGHRRYDQSLVKATNGQEDDNLKVTEIFRGEDNWRYVLEDLQLNPVKPTIDGEPSYEGIPQGLHDSTQPLWSASDARRYAYWSVFAGACGHTYGNNSVMQMHKEEFAPGSYSVSTTWDKEIDAPGARQMGYLKSLMEMFEYQKGVHSPTVVIGEEKEKYHRLIVNSGPGYSLIYAYTPQDIKVDLSKALPNTQIAYGYWFDPSTGKFFYIGEFNTKSKEVFRIDIKEIMNRDLVLVLTKVKL